MRATMRHIILAFLAAFLLIACDNNSDATVDPNVDPELLTIVIGPVDSNSSVYVKMPADIYGEFTEDLIGATVDIYRNGALVLSGVEVQSLFNPLPNEIIFNFSTVSAGDSLGFMANLIDGSEIFYLGIVSTSGESFANLSIPSFSGSVTEEGEVEAFFDNALSEEGSGSGSTFSGNYDMIFGTLSYSSDCEASVLREMNFFVDTSLTDEEIAVVLDSGQDGYDVTVIVTQTDGDITWDVVDTSSTDYAGIINDDGSFSIFDGSYVDETNYIYILYEGNFDSSNSSVSGMLTAKLILDGTRLENALEGSCIVTQSFEGTLAP